MQWLYKGWVDPYRYHFPKIGVKWPNKFLGNQTYRDVIQCTMRCQGFKKILWQHAHANCMLIAIITYHAIPLPSCLKTKYRPNGRPQNNNDIGFSKSALQPRCSTEHSMMTTIFSASIY